MTFGKTLLAVLLLLLVACSDKDAALVVNLPCTPVGGSERNPCEDSHTGLQGTTGAGSLAELPETPAPIGNFFGDGESIAATHFIARATFLPNTTRCTAGNPFRPADHQANTLKWAGSPGYLCFIDVRTNEYYVGDGPSRLSLLVWRVDQFSPDGNESLRQGMESNIGNVLGGGEYAVFLGPSFDVSAEVWQIFGLWKIGRKPDGSVVAIHPKRDRWMAEHPTVAAENAALLEMPLASFSKALKSTNEERVSRFGGRIGMDETLPMLVTDANNLSDYYEAVGAYDDGHVPAPPPPVPER